MELIEIKGLFEMDYGSPSPMIISNDNELCITFYADTKNSELEPQERDCINDVGVFTLKFKVYLRYIFGIPGNETIQGHPYFKLGLKSSAFYELRDSDLIKQLQDIEKSHPYYNSEKWRDYKHYILTFHDNMFECVAKGFDIREENISIFDKKIEVLNSFIGNV